ncbi:collagen alpha-1(I) chain-like [Manis pentadactyla]|uniref:collagen alpha-1(I) chain-like n=1 Tax=Manis pentadactyla TaxID=143292 RepID=UPI00255CC34E|nr:collagen alpha-1(I) chain-like [Manis pentadactyla]
MPRGSPLPPPLPPPPRPSRLSWPGPRRPPRTIMPFTAVGGRRWAAAAGARQTRSGPEGQGTREALRGAGRGCGVRPLGGLAGSMNRARQTHGARSSAPGCQESPCRWAAVAFLVVLPSFLSLKSKSFPRGGARAAARAGPAVSHPGLGGARGLQAARPRRAALARDGGRPGRISRGRSRQRRGRRGRGCGRGWRGRAESESGGRLHGLRAAAARSRSGPPATPGRAGAAAAPSRLAGSERAARRPGGTPSRPARPAARRRPWARVHPRRRLASGPRRLSSSKRPGPAHRPPRALRGRRAGSEGPRGAATRRGPGSCHVCQPPTSERAGKTERKGGGRGRWAHAAASPRACPRRARRFHKPGPRRARSLRRSFVWRHRRSFKSRFLLAPCPRPLRRSRMLARCAAPPPGSSRLWGAAPCARRAGLGARASGGPEGAGRGLRALPGGGGAAAGGPDVSSAGPGAPRFLPAERPSPTVTCSPNGRDPKGDSIPRDCRGRAVLRDTHLRTSSPQPFVGADLCQGWLPRGRRAVLGTPGRAAARGAGSDACRRLPPS